VGEQESGMRKILPLSDAALLFNLLGDRARLRILLLLSRRGEMSISDLGKAVGIQSVGVDYHLAMLRLHRIIDGRRRVVHDLLRFVEPERRRDAGGRATGGPGGERRADAARRRKARRRL
jgi:DNA-binding transcriptional ArsR family regulator